MEANRFRASGFETKRQALGRLGRRHCQALAGWMLTLAR